MDMKNWIKKIKRSVLRTNFYVYCTLWLQQCGFDIGPSKRNKVEKLRAAQRFFDINTFVETGTYLGTTLIALSRNFATLHSVELSPELAAEARRYFNNNKHITIHEGDSGHCIKNIVQNNSKRALFWLDAHYSGGVTAVSVDFGYTPISKELEEIFSAWILGSVILIDDARLFNGTDNYPTLEALEKYVAEQSLHLKVFVSDDIIHIY